MTRARSLVGVFSVACLLLTLPLAAEEGGQGAPGGRRGGQGQQGARQGFGQRAGGMTGAFATPVRLVGIEQVQKELKITEEQKAKLDELQTGLREGMGSMRGMRDLSPEEREKKMAELQETQKKAQEAAEKKLADILTKEQKTRLDQIAFQQSGVQGLKEEKVAKELKLTEDQLKKIDEALTWGNDERRKLMEAGRGQGGQRDPDAMAKMMENMEKIQKDVEAKAIAAMTKEQQEQYAKMKGAPFALDRRAMFGGQRGGRGGQGGPGGGAGGGERPAAERSRPSET